jgi:tetratricopeptide (TPR) repeat protein
LAWLAILEAEAFSIAGQHAGCLTALDRAETLVARSEATDRRRSHSPTLDQGSLTRLRGVYLSRLGQEEGARIAIDQGLSDRDPKRGRKGQVWCLIALGRTYARQGQIDAACSYLSQALTLAAIAPAKRLLHEIRQVRGELESYRYEPVIQNFDDQLRNTARGV